MSARERHKRILGRQAKVAGAIWGVFLAITTLLGGVQTFQNHQAETSVASAEQRSNFWRIISGDEPPSSTRVNNTFATDLRNSLGKINPEATSLPKEITEFRAGVNEYGGIQSEIGFNPFDSTGQSCEVCGGLSATMQDKLLLIKQGHVEQVIQSEVTASQPKGYNLAPVGLPLIAWFGMVYLGVGTFALVMAVRKDCLENDYTSSELDWSTNTGFSADKLKKYSRLISPGYFLVVLPLSKKKGASYDQLLETVGMTDDEHEIRELIAATDRLPESERTEARGKLEFLLDEIQKQVRNHVGSDRTFKETEADRVRTDVQAAVEDISERLAIRDRIMNTPMSDPMADVMREVEAAAGNGSPKATEQQQAVQERRQQPG